MKNIGGFYELEVSNTGNSFHPEALALSTGRACISYIIETLKPKKVYLPIYSCLALFEPFESYHVPVQTYSINQDLEVSEYPELKSGELIVYINYFGIKSAYVNALIQKYGSQIIIDNTHSFFEKSVNDNIISFTSARKYFGVPDGAYLYIQDNLGYKIPRFTNASVSHNVLRLNGKQKEAFEQFKSYEKKLDNSILRISTIAEGLLSHINYDSVKRKRIHNFEVIARSLNDFNRLKIEPTDSVKFCYPFLPERSINKESFHKENIFIPTLWPDVLERASKYSLEYNLTRDLLPLPIDHRYDEEDMNHMVSFIRSKILSGL